MDTQQVTDKVKANGKWASTQAKDTAKEVASQAKDTADQAKDVVQSITDRGADFITYLQDNFTDIVKNASSQSVALAKKYPVQAAVGGLVCGFLLGAALFRPSRS